MKKLKYIILGILTLTLLLMACEEQKIVTNFQECVDAGNAIMDSLPAQCSYKGQLFIDEESNQKTGKFNTGCQLDNDCIPLPYQCHPSSCINKEYESLFKINEQIACTMVSYDWAAYNVEDCVCKEGFCQNKNLQRNKQEICENLQGIYVPEYEECEYIAMEDCENLQGTFYECESACRHQTDVEFCTTQCVPVCKFN